MSSAVSTCSRLGLDAPTVWGEFTPLARAAGAINLGQGCVRRGWLVSHMCTGTRLRFPDWSPPPIVLESLRSAAIETDDVLANQYCRSEGHPKLVSALARRYSAVLERPIDPLTQVRAPSPGLQIYRRALGVNCVQVTVSVGATEGMFAVLHSLVSPGDEVVCLRARGITSATLMW